MKQNLDSDVLHVVKHNLITWFLFEPLKLMYYETYSI